MTPHVSVSPKLSPTRTEVRSVLHQHRIGSDSTGPGRGGSLGGAGRAAGRTAPDAAGAGDAGAGLCASTAVPVTRAAAVIVIPSVSSPGLVISSSGAAARP